MRSPAEVVAVARVARVARVTLATLSLALTACAVTDPVPASPTPTAIGTLDATPTAETTDPTPTRSADEGASPDALSLLEPGRPWDGAAILDEMQRSTRPGGVPEEIRTPAIAAEIAQAVWTVDGAGWDTVAAGGFCGASTCTVDLAGAHLGRAGEDLWTLEISRADGTVTPITSEVRSLPWDLVDAVDGLARELDADGDLGPMQLTTARWLPPPDEPGRFVLSYRSGGEEGSCAREVLLDAVRREIVEEGASGC